MSSEKDMRIDDSHFGASSQLVEVELAGPWLDSDAHAAADRTLRFLVTAHRAKGGAVLVLRGAELVAYTTCDLALDRVPAVRDAWEAREKDLRAGQVSLGQHCLLGPLIFEGRLLGLLFLDSPGRAASSGLDRFLRALASVLAGGPEGGEGVLPASRRHQRELLQETLDQNEWNIARVARILGVTRRTIYLRLRRYGMERKKVPKLLKGVLA